MLSLYVFGPAEQGFLDIDPGTVLDMESTTDLWDEDLVAGEFSLPVDLPWTGNNRRLLGFAERLENFSTAARSWRVVAYSFGFPEIPQGKLTLLEKSGQFSYRRGKFSATISGSKGLFGTAIKGRKLADLSLGGPITWAGMDSRQYATQHMQASVGTTPYFAFAPVAVEEFIDTGRNDYSGEFIAKDVANYPVQPAGGGWLFGRPKSDDVSQAAAPLTPEYNDYRTIPFFQLRYVLQQVFVENGYQVSGAFFSANQFEAAYLYNNVALEYPTTSYTDATRRMVPGEHMPDMLIADFLKAVFSFFNLYPVFTGAAEVVLHYRVQQLQQRRVAPMSNVVAAEFTATYADATEESGYTLQYQVGADGYLPERLKDRKDKTVVGTVATVGGLQGLPAPAAGFTTDSIAYVEAENMWYQVADAISNPLKWDAWADGLDDYKQGAGQRSVECGLSPLAQHVVFVPSAGLYSRQPWVATRQKGTYYNSKYTRVVNTLTSLHLFYILNNSVALPPSTQSHNRGAANNKLLPYSLAWAGPDGMAESLHTAWQAVKENMQVVKTEYVANQKVLADIAAANCHEIDGILFLPQKIERTIPLGATAVVHLVPL